MLLGCSCVTHSARLLLFVLGPAPELLTCRAKGAAWHGAACGANPALVWGPEPLQGGQHLAGIAGPSSSLPSANPAGFVSPDEKGPVWLASCTPGAVHVSRSVVPTRGIVFLSQEVQTKALQSLGGDGICEAAHNQPEDWKPQNSDGWSRTFSYGPIHSSFLADPLCPFFQLPPHPPHAAQQPSLVSQCPPWIQAGQLPPLG